MTSPIRDRVRAASRALAVASGAALLVALASSAALGGGPPASTGFGLKSHLGYGYGGHRVGVGPEGGYPFYSGPGYPHEAPPLRRLGKIVPFAYSGRPGLTCDGRSCGFEGVGPLVVAPPVVVSGMDRPGLPTASDYGCFSGAIPYPESAFAPGLTTLGRPASGFADRSR